MPERPKKLEEMVIMMWYAIVGTNGDGIQARLSKLESRPRSTWLMVKDIVLLLIPAIVLSHMLGII